MPGSTQYRARGWPLPAEWITAMSIETKPKAKSPAPRQAKTKRTRQQELNKLLNRKSGMSIEQIQKAFGWQPHSARAAISTLRKTGTVVERSDTDKGAVYRIAGAG